MSARRAGILLPVFSLPGPFGIGDMGPAARGFLAFLEDAGQTLWQMLPLGMTAAAFGNSPYSCLGAFGLDPLVLAPEDLLADGLVDTADLEALRTPPSSRIDYERVRRDRERLLAAASANWARRAPAALRHDLARFRAEHAAWVEDLALFLALRHEAAGAAWTTWPEGLRDRTPEAMEAARRRLRPAVDHHVRIQYLADRQWRGVRAEARRRGVRLVGDLPLYVAHDSADVWSHRELFTLAADGRVAQMAGVPPDYFSATGQLWGNPTYRWARHREEDFAWWRARIADVGRHFDVVRLDHFRGISAYWEVPAGEATAQAGHWVEGPGDALLAALRGADAAPRLIAEDLGRIDDAVRALMRRFALPGMRVLQFGFGDDFPRSEHLPAFYPPELVAYTGTHDNNTTRGWFEAEASDRARARLAAYVGHRLDAATVAPAMVALAFASPASWAVVPLQDVQGLGEEARLNRPGCPEGNWAWRASREALDAASAARLRNLVVRTARRGEDPRPAGG